VKCARGKGFSLFPNVQTGFGTLRASCYKDAGFSSRVKRPGLEADGLLCSSMVKNEWSFTYMLPIHTFHGVHRESCVK
jgi:hypothetical protein